MEVHGNGKQIRHYLHVDDLTDGILLILKKTQRDKVKSVHFNDNNQINFRFRLVNWISLLIIELNIIFKSYFLY